MYKSNKKDCEARETSNQAQKGKKFTKKSNRNTRYDKTGKPEDKATAYENRRGLEVNQYVGQGNDPKWYDKNARLVADASKIPFANQLGAVVDTYQPQGGGADMGYVEASYAPGIMSLYMVNVPGIASKSSDGPNLAAAGLFQFIRKNLSTVATYAPADTMIYVLALDEIYSMYSNILRAFGIVNAYSAINLYMPDALLAAGYGFDTAAVNEFKRNINVYRSRFNNLIYKASTLYLPTDFSITSRHAWLYSNYFTDSTSLKAQIYVHRMGVYHILNETISEEGSYLETKSSPTNMEALLNIFSNMIDAVRNSDSMLRIAADMRRAFEGRAQWKLAYCDEAYMVLPTYDELVVSQIHNSTIVSENVMSGSNMKQWDISQSVTRNTITFSPHFVFAAATDSDAMVGLIPAMSGKIIDMHKDEVTSDDILEATRGMVTMYAAKDIVDNTYDCYVMSCGADVCYAAMIYQMNAAGAYDRCAFVGNVLNFTSPMNWAKIFAQYIAFKNCPQLFASMDSTMPKKLQCILELDNYTTVPNSTIERMNDNIICSMWSIPQFGGFDA